MHDLGLREGKDSVYSHVHLPYEAGGHMALDLAGGTHTTAEEEPHQVEVGSQLGDTVVGHHFDEVQVLAVEENNSNWVGDCSQSAVEEKAGRAWDCKALHMDHATHTGHREPRPRTLITEC